nr:hypothetical protein [Candidatus Freyarchaeota archaeon]
MVETKDDSTLILELKAIRRDFAYIKKHMIEVDNSLTTEELIVKGGGEGV